MNNTVQNTLSKLLKLNPETTQLSTISSGHINSTWLLTHFDQRFIVQKLNNELDAGTIYAFAESKVVIYSYKSMT